jgi:hypothetical protein
MQAIPARSALFRTGLLADAAARPAFALLPLLLRLRRPWA